MNWVNLVSTQAKPRGDKRKALREHQIAISLKPQQFELLQKLAKERGFKSVTAYLKQKIVELALGVESEQTGAVRTASSDAYANLSGENQILLVELTRIHNELRAFADNVDPMSGGVSVSGADNPFDLPPPGQFAGAAGPSPVDLGSSTGYLSGGAASVTPAEGVSSQVLPSSNLGGFGFRLGGFSSGNVAGRFQPPVENNDRLSGYREIMDDLEELADRAFAISPRLGALDENAAAEPATGRGARSSSESIFVEPILPQSAASSVAKVEPISMVKPVSAAELPGPSEMAASKQSVKNESFSVPVQNPEAVPEITPVSRPDPAAEAASTSAPASTPAPEPPPTPELEPEPEPEPEPQPSLPLPSAPPLPGDDLLSDLLDESLVAHAVAPRPADNPFAAVNLGFEKYGTADGAETADEAASSGHDDSFQQSDLATAVVSPAPPQVSTPPFVDPDQADDSNSSGSSSGRPATADMGQEPYSDLNDGLGTMTSEEEGEQKAAQSAVQAVRPYKDVASSGAADPTTSAGAAPPYTANSPDSPDSLDSTSGGQSNQSGGVSGGPPPRRRRT